MTTRPSIEPGDVEIETEAREGFAVQSDGRLTAALDTALTDDLVDEGFAREMINKIQFMRKEAGFDVVDRINVYYEAGDQAQDSSGALRIPRWRRRHLPPASQRGREQASSRGNGT